MTDLLIDSTVLIDASRGRAPALEFLAEAAEAGPLSSTVLVRSELWGGARPDEERGIGRLIDTLLWHDVTPSIADLAGRLALRYRRSHSIGIVDFVLAATAIELDGSIATLNVRHFPMFPDLKPPY